MDDLEVMLLQLLDVMLLQLLDVTNAVHVVRGGYVRQNSYSFFILKIEHKYEVNV